MSDWGPSIGESSSIFGIVFKVVKAVIVYGTMFSVLLIESHMLFFGVANLFINKYNFELKVLKPNYVINGYNNFLYFFTKIVQEMSSFTSILIVLFILSIIFISHFHSKRKKFPGVIIGTIINNTITLVIYALFTFLIEKIFTGFIQGLVIICQVS